MTPKPEIRKSARLPLAFIPAGQQVRLAGFGDEIDPLQIEQLTAYGLAESRPLKVLQQRPMTVILADEVELALEHAVARDIWVEKDAGGVPGEAVPRGTVIRRVAVAASDRDVPDPMALDG